MPDKGQGTDDEEKNELEMDDEEEDEFETDDDEEADESFWMTVNLYCRQSNPYGAFEDTSEFLLHQ